MMMAVDMLCNLVAVSSGESLQTSFDELGLCIKPLNSVLYCNGDWKLWRKRESINFLISRSSKDLLSMGTLPIMPLYLSKLKHQKPCTGPWSITMPYKWQWRCIFGVTDFLPYISNSLQNFTRSMSAFCRSVVLTVHWRKYLQVKTKVCQHRRWLSPITSLRANTEYIRVPFFYCSAV